MSRLVVVTPSPTEVRARSPHKVLPAVESSWGAPSRLLERHADVLELILCDVDPEEVSRWVTGLARLGCSASIIVCRMDALELWLGRVAGHQPALAPQMQLVDEVSAVATVGFDAAGRVDRWEDAASSLFGVPREVALGQAITRLVSPASRAQVAAAWAELSRGVGGFFCEAECTHPDGLWLRLRWHAVPRRDTSGNFLGCDAVFLNLDSAHILNEQADLLAEFGGLGFFEADLRSGKATYSPAWKRMLGYAPEELADDYATFRRLVHAGDYPPLAPIAGSLRITQRQPFQSRFRMRHKNGSWRWISCAGVAFLNDARETLRATGYHIDITELVEAQRLYKDLVRRFPDGLMGVVAPDFNVIITGGEGWSVIGTDPDSYHGRNILDMVRPDRREAIERFWRRVFEGRHVVDEVRLPNGRTLAYRGVPLRDEEDRIYAGLCVGFDITEERLTIERLAASEERVRTVLEELPVAVSIFGSEGHLRLANRLARELASASGSPWLLESLPLGPDVRRLENGIEVPLVSHPAVRVARSGVALRGAVLRRGGTDPRWFQVDALPVDDGSGGIEVVMTVVELTERYRAEAALRRSLEEKELLLKEVYHRVKNNLQVVASLVALESRQTGRKSGVQALKDLGGRVQAMSLVHEQLYQARDLTRIEFSHYARTLATNLQRSLQGEAPAVVIEVSAEAAHLPLATAIPLGLILNELVSNALKHAFHGRAAGRVRVAFGPEGAGVLKLSVTDDGPATTPPQPGADSLGLRIVCTFAAQLRGSAEWTCGEAGGVCALVRLPDRGVE